MHLIGRGLIAPLLATLAVACSGAAPSASAAPDAGGNADPAPVSGGRDLFMYYCAKCHGVTGLGDGPSVGSLRTQAGLNLTILAKKSDAELDDTIAGGKGTDMPPWELRLRPEQRAEIIQFVRQLQKP